MPAARVFEEAEDIVCETKVLPLQVTILSTQCLQTLQGMRGSVGAVVWFLRVDATLPDLIKDHVDKIIHLK